MAIYGFDGATFAQVSETTFSKEGILERANIQKALLKNIGVLDGQLMVIAEEFGNWDESLRRIDLLCIDLEANLVVVELKRTEDGGHMDLQALRYAAMISVMTFDQLVDAHAVYLKCEAQEARASILAFLKWKEHKEDNFAQNVRIVLAAADFGKELTTAVLWLNEKELDIRCVRLRPYRLSDGRILVDAQQLIPLPEAAEYQMQIGRKRRAERASVADRRSSRRDWWEALRRLPDAWLHVDVEPPNSPYFVAREQGNEGWHWAYILSPEQCGVELYLDLRNSERTEQLFGTIYAQKAEIEVEFGADLIWEQVPKRGVCKIRYEMVGGHHSTDVPDVQARQVAAMSKLERTLRPHLSVWATKG